MRAASAAHAQEHSGLDGAASCSSSAPETTTAPFSSSCSGFGILELPRECMVRVMMVLSAPDVCRMARVCRTFRVLADSDEVWKSRIPDDPAISPPSLSRKDLFFRLRAGMLFKDPSQPYWLDPATGEGCFVIPARLLHFVCGNDRSYWTWQPQPDSWFAESVLLRKVCWFEVVGDFEGMFLAGAYTVLVRLKLMDNLRGWASAPVELSLSTSHGQHVESQRFFYVKQNSLCSWMQLDMGEFVMHKEMCVKVQFCMRVVEGGRWKKGVILDCVKIQRSNAILKP